MSQELGKRFSWMVVAQSHLRDCSQDIGQGVITGAGGSGGPGWLLPGVSDSREGKREATSFQ